MILETIRKRLCNFYLVFLKMLLEPSYHAMRKFKLVNMEWSLWKDPEMRERDIGIVNSNLFQICSVSLLSNNPPSTPLPPAIL